MCVCVHAVRVSRIHIRTAQRHELMLAVVGPAMPAIMSTILVNVNGNGIGSISFARREISPPVLDTQTTLAMLLAGVRSDYNFIAISMHKCVCVCVCSIYK